MYMCTCSTTLSFVLHAAGEEDDLMEQWLNLINERSGLEKLAAELTLK